MRNSMTYFETSCKTGENILDFFEKIASDLVRQHHPKLVSWKKKENFLLLQFDGNDFVRFFSSILIYRWSIISRLIITFLQRSIIVSVKNFVQETKKRRLQRNRRNSFETNMHFDFSFVVIRDRTRRSLIEVIFDVFLSRFVHWFSNRNNNT